MSHEANTEDYHTKRGRGADKAKILVMVSFDEKIDVDGNLIKYLKSAAMEVIENFTSTEIGEQMTKWIAKHAKIYTDKFKSYIPLKKEFDEINMNISSGKLAQLLLPIVHQQIGNLKGDILGIYRCVSQLHLQNYLSEFCYKLNRRFMLEPKYKGKSILENIVLQSVIFCGSFTNTLIKFFEKKFGEFRFFFLFVLSF